MTPSDIKSALGRAITGAAQGTGLIHAQKLPPETLIRFLIGAEGGSLAKELHSAGIEVTPAAVSQRRAQIPPDSFREVFHQFNAACVDVETFRGYRVLAVDGTAVNMPRNPNAPSFVQNSSAPKGYNQLHVNPLYDVLNKIYCDVLIQPEPQKDEIGALIEMLKRNDFQQKTLIIADRGYESYNLLAYLIEKSHTDFLIRIKQNHSAMREVARLPMFELDCDIAFTITTTQTNDDKKNRYVFLQVPKKSKPGVKTRRGRWDFQSPYTMKLRIVRFQLSTGEFETIATSLPRSFTPQDIKELYRWRWKIEESHKAGKYSIGLVNLHGKSDEFVQQEIYAALTMFNFTSRIVREVVVKQPKNGIYAYQLNFKMAVALCREFFKNADADVEELVRQIARHTIPIRPGRRDNRNLRAKGFVGFVYRVAA